MNSKNVRWLKSKLTANQGFIMLNNIVMMASLFALVISMMIILKSMTTSLIFFVDNWMIQTETQRILEDIAVEITYADTIEYEDDIKDERRIFIITRRRATKLIDDEQKYIAYFNKGDTIYRQEVNIGSDGKYNVLATQPLNGNSFWGYSNMKFYLTKLDDKLYKINIQAQGYASQQQLFMQTIALQRNEMEIQNEAS